MRNPLRRKALTATPTVVEAVQTGSANLYMPLGGSNISQQRISAAFVQAQSASYAHLYRTQPAVRSVVDYIARNVAQLGLKCYERVSDDERRHAGDHPGAVSLRRPNPQTPGQQLVFTLVADFLVYDNAYALKFRGAPDDRMLFLNVPAHAVGLIGDGRFSIDGYRVWRADGSCFDVAPDAMFHWRGYDPENPRGGFSKLETLRQELAADATARAAKTELDRAGLMPKGWIERPADAPEWSDPAQRRFSEAWANQLKGQNRRTPVLEEGMEFKQAGVSPENAQLLESRQFTRDEVAAIFGMEHVPPQDEDERRQFYADVLPPYCEMLCSYLDLQVLQHEYEADSFYFEFNLDEKQMSDDRLKAITSAVGAPPLTRNEGRARLNLPPREGGDELITPANVIVGDNPLPSIGVMPIQDPNGPPQDGSHREASEQPVAIGGVPRTPAALPSGEQPVGETLTKASAADVTLQPRRKADMDRQQRNVDKGVALLERHYARLSRSLRAKAEFDRDRWDQRLGNDIHQLVKAIFEQEGGIYVARLGGEDFDMRFVENYLRAMSDGMAEAINDVTASDIDELGVDAALQRARSERAETAGAAIGARATIQARYEAAKQAPDVERRTKTWLPHTKRHQSVGGETVALGESFSIGFEPGSAPGCQCSVSVQ